MSLPSADKGSFSHYFFTSWYLHDSDVFTLQVVLKVSYTLLIFLKLFFLFAALLEFFSTSSSKSLIQPSILSNLLCIPSSVLLISDTAFFISDWPFFTVSMSFFRLLRILRIVNLSI